MKSKANYELKEEPVLVNLTPHDINFLSEDRRLVHILRSSGIARCIAYRVKENQVTFGNNVVDINFSCFSTVEGLPAEEENVAYIVSKPVADALRGVREDLYIVDRVVRNKQGVVLGCRGLARIG